MPSRYLIALSVVVPTEGIEGSHLHPATAQLLTGVVKESADVGSDLKHVQGRQLDIQPQEYISAWV